MNVMTEFANPMLYALCPLNFDPYFPRHLFYLLPCFILNKYTFPQAFFLFPRFYFPGHKNLAEEVEIVNLRVEGIGRLDETKGQERSFGTDTGPGVDLNATESSRNVVFDGEQRRARVIDRRAIAPVEPIRGPAIIEEPTCTTLVPPGWTASVHGAGHLLMRHHG